MFQQDVRKMDDRSLTQPQPYPNLVHLLETGYMYIRTLECGVHYKYMYTCYIYVQVDAGSDLPFTLSRRKQISKERKDALEEKHRMEELAKKVSKPPYARDAPTCIVD